MTSANNISKEHLVFHGSGQVDTVKESLINWIDTKKPLQDKYNRLSNIFLIVSILSVIVSFLLISTGNSYVGIFVSIFLIVTCITFVCFIYTKSKAQKYRKIFRHAYRTKISKKLIELLNRDIDDNSTLDFKISYKSDRDRNSKVSTSKHPYKSGWKVAHYRHEWLSIRGKFIDNNRFYLNLSKISKTAYGTKRSRSGKLKSKSKTKDLGLELNLICRYSQKRYGAVMVLKDDLIKALKIPDKSTIRKVKLTSKAIVWIVRINPQSANNVEIIYKTITMMFLSVYQALNLAKKMTR